MNRAESEVPMKPIFRVGADNENTLDLSTTPNNHVWVSVYSVSENEEFKQTMTEESFFCLTKDEAKELIQVLKTLVAELK